MLPSFEQLLALIVKSGGGDSFMDVPRPVRGDLDHCQYQNTEDRARTHREVVEDTGDSSLSGDVRWQVQFGCVRESVMDSLREAAVCYGLTWIQTKAYQ